MNSLFLLSLPVALTSCATSAVQKRYVCGCDHDCPNCTTASDKPGKWACGKPLVLR